MLIRLRDEADGQLKELRPAAPPACAVSWAPFSGDGFEFFRWEVFRSFVERALDYMAHRVVAPGEGKADVHCGAAAPDGGALWLKPGGVSGLVRLDEIRSSGFDPLDLRLLCLKTHYRKPLAFSWDALEDARGERAALLEIAARLGADRVAPNATGLAGYKKRFRDALADDLDSPEAVATVWDALRPGALSPGSRLAALKDADLVLDLLRLG